MLYYDQQSMCMIGINDSVVFQVKLKEKIRQLIISKESFLVHYSKKKIGTLESFSWQKQVMQHTVHIK